MKEIPLTQGMVAIVDDEDHLRLSKYKWYARRSINTFYARCSLRRIKGKPRPYLIMHRVILNAPAGLEVDHKDGNGLNNTRANLRLVTRRQNVINSAGRRDACAGSFKGLTRSRR